MQIICIQLYRLKYSYPILIVFNQIYLTHGTLTGTTTPVQSGPGSIKNKEELITPLSTRTRALPSDAVLSHTQVTTSFKVPFYASDTSSTYFLLDVQLNKNVQQIINFLVRSNLFGCLAILTLRRTKKRVPLCGVVVSRVASKISTFVVRLILN